MKTLFIVTVLLMLVVSCGNKSSSVKSKRRGTSRVEAPLTREEKVLCSRLIDLVVITQKELILSLSGLSKFNDEVLKKLDSKLSILCSQSSGLCYITKKDSL